MREIDDLIDGAMRVINTAYEHGGQIMAPLFSGGHDSLCAVHLASQHPQFTGDVHHIDTGIGAAYTRRFVEGVCDRFGWRLHVWKSPSTYQEFVLKHGFPGPAFHGPVYNHLKDRCVRMVATGSERRVLISGCRAQESVRRMGHVEPVKVGEWPKKAEKAARRFLRMTHGELTDVLPGSPLYQEMLALKAIKERKRIWTAPCHDWSKAEQQLYMDEFGLPQNKLKLLLGMSGECGCGCFAEEGEIELWKSHAPDVASKIAALSILAKDRGVPCVWGTRPEGCVVTAETGPLCSACDERAMRQKLLIVET